ncbi:1,4-alpha-glucan branching protein GlgB [Caldicellulosiruptor acetigenus]|uniref:1,4-alpha-glucan branching enzyme GlgB n=1 Tax=Caldicellulosiruptor acetigenus 6A TaxID=632516 RepID=G2PX37_9FIRM|nr:1,4-alpha-glucan branching protein GlgB [Caldicellulosiruptor acetigenus]AEM72992.1 1,4-alpha-glucan-branching enzyme [Caldicellulosiruptor acetigenus 6A]
MIKKVKSTIYLSDIKKFESGEHFESYKFLGSRVVNYRGKVGTVFCVWAPNAKSVSVVGDFNNWCGENHKMMRVYGSGFWWLFVEGIGEGELYKYEIIGADGKRVLKADPYAIFSELRPNTASIVKNIPDYDWHDQEWMEKRKTTPPYDKPINIYEVHLASWKMKKDGSIEKAGEFYNYRELAHMLVDYIKEMNYTHIELLPVLEHPLDMSWGYQPTGYFSLTSRYGSIEDFMYFVDIMHQNGIGVIVDWVPAHFCKDEHGLYRFDGTFLYEYEDELLRENYTWGTATFDFSKPQVQSFLISSAMFWFDVYHIDGIRVDAVSHIIYMNNNQKNRYGGHENIEGIEFIKKLNKAIFSKYPNVLMIAEESTAFPLVTYPTYDGGLGFNYKWNMGWMNDTLKYMQKHPNERKHHHNLLTFSIMYAFSENFILPFSHDEVVHGKKSLLDKMPGDYNQKFANLRLLYGYMYTHPGKKLLFMGGEFGQFIEWRFYASLDWLLLDYPMHRMLQHYVKSLNRFYLENKALWELDHKMDGFRWIDVHNWQQSVISYLRFSKDPDDFLVVICNFGLASYENYKIGVPRKGVYLEVFNSDKAEFGGNNIVNTEKLKTIDEVWHGYNQCIEFSLPALSCLIFKPVEFFDSKPEKVKDTDNNLLQGGG